MADEDDVPTRRGVAASKEGRHWLRNVGMATAPQFFAFLTLALLLIGSAAVGVVVWRQDSTVQKQMDQSARQAAEQRDDLRRIMDDSARERATRDAAYSARELRVLDGFNKMLDALRDNTQVLRAVHSGIDRQADDSKRLREMLVEQHEELKKLRIAVDKLAKCIESAWECDAAPMPRAKGWKDGGRVTPGGSR